MTTKEERPSILDEKRNLENAVIVPITVTYMGSEYQVNFDRDFWTPKRARAYDKAKLLNVDFNIAIISKYVESWNIPSRKGGVLALTAEVLEDANTYLLDAVTDAMFQAVNPNWKKTSQP